MPRVFGYLFALFAAGSCGDSEDELPRLVVDCSDDETACDDVKESGCSVVLSLVDEEGQVVGACGEEIVERRVCTTHCETDGNCPDGWRCLLPDGCPGENFVRYCVPTATELELQELHRCRGDASPEVCGFF